VRLRSTGRSCSSGGAESTRVCSYDRAGLEWSERGPTCEVVEQIVDEPSVGGYQETSLLITANREPPHHIPSEMSRCNNFA
jgi:hypothetical protein